MPELTRHLGGIVVLHLTLESNRYYNVCTEDMTISGKTAHLSKHNNWQPVAKQERPVKGTKARPVLRFWRRLQRRHAILLSRFPAVPNKERGRQRETNNRTEHNISFE